MNGNRKYVFLTPAIGNIGGSQMYIRNKVNFLKRNGWDVSVFYFQYFDILIDDLSEYQSGYINELRYGIQYLTSKQRERVLVKLQGLIGDYSDLVIESNMFRLSYWAELLAKNMNARHILAPLEEEIPKISVPFVQYLEFKLKRRECLNSTETSLKRFFRSSYKEEYAEYIFPMDFCCSNVIDASIEHPLALEKSDFNIMTIGRLEKPFVMTMFDEFRFFSLSHPEKLINVLIIGASPMGDKEEEIRRLFEKIETVRLYFMGFVFPIPTSYFANVDVAVSSANSVMVSANQGIPTIPVDMYDYYAMGIYGETTENIFYRTDEPKIKISSLLEEVLIEKKYGRRVSDNCESDSAFCFYEQLKFIERCNKKKDYYDTTRLFSRFDNIVGNCKRYVHEFFKK